MTSDKPRPTRAPGTPVGHLLTLQGTHGLPSQTRPKPTKRPASPLDCLCSPSASYTSAASCSPSPTVSAPSPTAKPRPSKAPHLRPFPREDAPLESSCKFSPEFGPAIDFSFCHSFPQPLTDDSAVSQRRRRLKSRACAKLMVRSGHCSHSSPANHRTGHGDSDLHSSSHQSLSSPDNTHRAQGSCFPAVTRAYFLPTRLSISPVPKPSPGRSDNGIHQNAHLALPGLTTPGP